MPTTSDQAERTYAGTAPDVAADLLAGVGTRVAHSQCVAHQAAHVRPLIPGRWGGALVDAAWLHDIGYNERLARASFHPLDGARWLKERGWPEEVCRLVAWHSGAHAEAVLRGLADALTGEFPPPPDIAQAALTWADLTSSPAGECCEVEERLADILRRYTPESVVHRAVSANLDWLQERVQGIEERLVHGQVRPS